MRIEKFSYVRKMAMTTLASLALAGCFDGSQDAGLVQTVDWYKVNDDERRAKLEECGNNPGELQDTPNCINALQAERTLSSGEPFELDLSSLKSEADS